MPNYILFVIIKKNKEESKIKYPAVLSEAYINDILTNKNYRTKKFRQFVDLAIHLEGYHVGIFVQDAVYKKAIFELLRNYLLKECDIQYKANWFGTGICFVNGSTIRFISTNSRGYRFNYGLCLYKDKNFKYNTGFETLMAKLRDYEYYQ